MQNKNLLLAASKPLIYLYFLKSYNYTLNKEKTVNFCWRSFELYQEMARKFHISPSSVERDLRTLIRSCWEEPDRSFLEHVAGRALSKPPTNSEFIDMLAAFLRK